MTGVDDRVGAIRGAFDDTFTRPPTAATIQAARLLAVRVAGGALALPLTSLAGVLRVRGLVPLRGAAAELLGLLGHRGRTLAVFDLGSLVGRAALATAPTWVVVARAPSGDVGLAVDAVIGETGAGDGDRMPLPAEQVHPVLSEAVRIDGCVLPICDIDQLFASLEGGG